MSRRIRTKAAELAVEAAHAMDDHVTTATVFALAIFFENWILDGGDATQELMKILPEEKAKILHMVRQPGWDAV